MALAILMSFVTKTSITATIMLNKITEPHSNAFSKNLELDN